jgi:hypothetical protein
LLQYNIADFGHESAASADSCTHACATPREQWRWNEKHRLHGKGHEWHRLMSGAKAWHAERQTRQIEAMARGNGTWSAPYMSRTRAVSGQPPRSWTGSGFKIDAARQRMGRADAGSRRSTPESGGARLSL